MTFDSATVATLQSIVARMIELMKQHGGVGLAGPQAGVDLRLFVMNPTGEPGDEKAYVNPVLSDADGEEEDEEGCLSLPDIRTPVLRASSSGCRPRRLTAMTSTRRKKAL